MKYEFGVRRLKEEEYGKDLNHLGHYIESHTEMEDCEVITLTTEKHLFREFKVGDYDYLMYDNQISYIYYKTEI